MVSVEEGGVVFFLNPDEEFDNAFGVGSTINVVPDKNEVIFRCGRDDFDHFPKWIKAAVNVADGKCSHGSGGMISRSGTLS